MTLKKRLLTSLSIHIFLLIIFLMFWLNFYYNISYERALEEDAMMLIHDITNLHLLTDEYLMYQSSRSIEQWNYQYDDILYKLGNRIDMDKSNSIDFENLYPVFLKLQSVNIQLHRINTDSLSQNQVSQLLIQKNRFTSLLSLKIRDILVDFNNVYKTSFLKGEKIRKNSLVIISMYLIIVIIFSVLNSLYNYNKIIPPLNILLEKVQQMGSFKRFGNSESLIINFSTNIDEEIEKFGIGFNAMVERLTTSFGRLEEETKKRQSIEKEIIFERDKLGSILDSMTDGVSIVGENYDIQYVNPSLLKKFGPPDWKKCFQYFHNLSEPCSWCKKLEVPFRKNIPWEWTSEKTGKSYDIIDTPIKNKDGSISILEISREITERKELEFKLLHHKENLENLVSKRTEEIYTSNERLSKSQQAMRFLLEDVNLARNELQNVNENLLKSNKDLEAFSHSVSHDLRSPLRAVAGFSAKLQRRLGESSDTETLRLMTVISVNTSKMQDLITDLLSFSKVNTKIQSFGNLDMNNLVSSLCRDFEEEMLEKNIECRISSLPDAIGNYSMLKQVFINLIDNAVKFRNLNTRTEIEIGYRKSENAYYVKDNGCGFDPKFSESIFDIFKRITNDTDVNGTGVGLAIVKRIIESHGGQVWAESKPGEGSVFYYSLGVNKQELS
jgi:signal transduction histidine kinase